MWVIPARLINGRIRLPGDKSISHRAALIAALATGGSRISNFSTSQDCTATLSCLTKLGVSIEREGNDIRVEAEGTSGLRAPSGPLDCGNSGSTIRMLAGVLAGLKFTSTLTGDNSLRSRPMKRIIEPLEKMGARIHSEDGKPPLTIEGRPSLKGIRYVLPVASAQVKSCVLLSGLQAAGRTELIETLGITRDHTERMLKWFGVPVETKASIDGFSTVTIDGPANFAARDVDIPGDISSASFFIAGAALLPGSKLEIEGVGLNPTRTQFLSTLHSLGLEVDTSGLYEGCNELVGTVRALAGTNRETGKHRKPNLVNGALIPQLIDELPLLAIVGTQIPGGIEIRDAAELRFKETDRISVTVKNLRAMGAEVEEFEDGLAVTGPTQLRGAKLDPEGDHRIAMAFTIAALIADNESEIVGVECVAISFPEFFELLDSLVKR
ncbi:MAG: 3-phosphoshikimate 1-carboxyvinyltransferase [Acidobacteriota bacterium]|nr:3-phosphoshikimate 1-carboxyvinyltransferase [Acidobacteriota bacterium]